MGKSNSSSYVSKVQSFADRMKADATQVNVQKVTPIPNESPVKEEQQLNVWIPKSLIKQLKVKGVETDKSLKEMVIEAITMYI